MSLQTLNDVFFAIVEGAQPQVMLYHEADQWVPVSSQEFHARVVAVAHLLRDWGISRGDRVAILSENRPEWTIADFASLLLGAVVVPVYTTLTPEQTAYILRDSGARAIFVSSQKHLQKIVSVQGQTAIEKIAVMDDVENVVATNLLRTMRDSSKDPDPQLEAAARAVGPDDLATIIYTSGTTGTPQRRHAYPWQHGIEYCVFAKWI